MEETGYVNKGVKPLWAGAISMVASLLPNF